MDRRGNRLRFAAVSVLVVLALTGFSTGKSRGHDSGDDGGCSSSGQDHDGSSSGGGPSSSGPSASRDHDYGLDATIDTTDTGGGGSVAQTPARTDVADIRLERCATADVPNARLYVSNYNDTEGVFLLHVDFVDASGDFVEERTMKVKVAARDWTMVQVNLDPADAAKVDHCEVEPVAKSA
ncbi:hypothetical protein [Streptomyces phaeofaciens]|uniref:hypothetical protein n=1 Tax=Streptomyces phaeofaciens TaxID=68254 RepID=UPI0016782CFA|nr:hypothetical protein [Streptomyces phaeofaciens]